MAERKTGLKREHITLGAAGILIFYLIFGWYRDFVCNFIGFLYPAYASLLAVESLAKPNDTKWLIYWVVYFSFGFIEYYRYTFFYYLFCYWLVKCIFLIWLMMAGPLGGTHIIYYKIKYLMLKYNQNTQNFYNDDAGKSDILNANRFDQYGNPIGKTYDLGRDGAFSNYSILIGQFYSDKQFNDAAMQVPINALKEKGFHVKHVHSETEFISEIRLNRCHIAWVISSSSITNNTFISVLTEFHSSGGAIFLFADNTPFIWHASEFLNKKFGIILTGDFYGCKILTYKENGHQQTGYFGQHEIFTGIKNLFEGHTICHPVYPKSLNRSTFVTLATGTDGNPCIAVYDPTSTEGRICLDCGFTKLYMNWDSAGTSRYIANVSCWLLRVEKRF